MSGMSRTGGHQMPDEVTHIRQSIADILTTPVGSRIKRREYGSLLPDLIDHPANPSNRLRLMSATVMAIVRWEPRVAVQSATITVGIDGKTVVDMEAIRLTGPRAGHRLNLAIPLQ